MFEAPSNVTTMYKHAMSDCDVMDHEKLKVFRQKREEWIAWLKGDDPHSIWRQVNRLLWDYVLFRTINDLRRVAVEHPSPNVGFNPDVLRLLDAGFATTQATAVRRLTDKPNSGPKKGVLSLRRLIEDIKAHREVITREVYVAYDGLPYDLEPAQQAWLQQQLASGEEAFSGWLPTTGQNAWHTAEMVHRNFDRLAGVAPADRSRGDLILPRWFDYLDEKLKACDGVRKFVDKFIAHAADPASREGLTQDQTALTLDRLNTCHKAIYQVAAFIYGRLLWVGSYGAVPVPQYNHLENLDKCWVAPEEQHCARDYWNRNLAVVEAWAHESLWPDESA
ncbi:hypothetical protein EPO44_11610 [bacterium]|nr:MAG: hypothetical protein EPO44_11610 [bacterium]